MRFFVSECVCACPRFQFYAFFCSFLLSKKLHHNYLKSNKYLWVHSKITNSNWNVVRKQAPQTYTDSLNFCLRNKSGSKKIIKSKKGKENTTATNKQIVIVKNQIRETCKQTIDKYKLWLETRNHEKKVRDVCEMICNCFISRWPQVINCNIFTFFFLKFYASNEKKMNSSFFFSRNENIEEKEW